MNIPDDVVYVCDEVGNTEEFVYSPYNQTYYKRFKKTKNLANPPIRGANLPNPFELERARLDRQKYIKENGGDVSNMRIKCTEPTHKLWQHWQEQLNNEDKC